MTRKIAPPTIADVAREAGVSITTVSRILNDSPLVAPATLTKVRQTIHRLGYTPHSAARNLALRRTNTIGILLESVGSSFFASVVTGVEEAAYENGFGVLIATPSQVHPGERPVLGPYNADGLLIIAVQFNKDLLSSYPEGYPIITMYQPAPAPAKVPLISVENERSAFKMTEHLIREHGFSRIAFLRGTNGNYDSECRETGYRLAMQQHGLTVDEDLVGYGAFGYSYARREVYHWYTQGCMPQAIFAANDDSALDTVFALNSLGLRVPQDVAVVGFDDARMAPNMIPPLTTVRAPGASIGREAARQMLHLIHTGESTPLTLLPTDLVVRSSCGCLAVENDDLLVKALEKQSHQA